MTSQTTAQVQVEDPAKQTIDQEIFRIVSIELNQASATAYGGKRLPKTRLVLQNGRTISLQGIDWNNVLSFKAGDVVKVTGILKEYRGQPQVNIQSIELAGEFDPSQLLPTYPGDVSWLESRFAAYIKAIPDPRLSKLAEKLVDPETVLGKKLRLAPASPAAISHEPYIHGLLQHLVEVAETAQALAVQAQRFRPCDYGKLNMSFVMFGAILHDLAKVTSYDYGTDGIKFSVAGRLNGHLIESYALLRNALYDAAEFTQDEIDQILHIVASHHGGESDNPPRTLEAAIVHHADSFCSELGSKFGFPHNT